MRTPEDRITRHAEADVRALRRAGFQDEYIQEMTAASVLEVAKAIRLLEKANGRSIQNVLQERENQS